MAEDDIRLKDTLIGIAAIIAMDVLLVVTVFVMMKSGLAAGGLGTIMPAALALSVVVPTAALVYYLKHRGISLGVVSLACYLLLAPLAEEIVFRRLLMGYLDRRVPAFASVVLSSLLFGVAHIAPPVMVYATFLGMGCALVTRFHDSLRAGFIVHLVNNVAVQLIAVSAL